MVKKMNKWKLVAIIVGVSLAITVVSAAYYGHYPYDMFENIGVSMMFPK